MQTNKSPMTRDALWAQALARAKQPGSVVLREFMQQRQAKRQGLSLVETPAVFSKAGRRTFSAGGHNRLNASFSSQDIALNTLLESQLATIRARSRNLGRNTSPGRRYLSLVRNNIVGPTGFRLQSSCGDYKLVNGKQKWVLDTEANDAIATHFKIWCQANHCDITGQSTFTDITALNTVGLARDGEFITREIIGTKDTPYRYQLQVLAIDRLDLNFHGELSNGNTVRMGIERNRAGKPVAGYILESNPNDHGHGTNSQVRVRVVMAELIHKFVRIDAEQIRGVPWAHAVMNGQNMLQLFEDAAVTAAVVGASNMGFFKPPSPGEDGYAAPNDDTGHELADEIDANGELIQDAVGGTFRILPEGYTLENFNPAYPHAAFDPFVQSRKRDMASGLDVAHHNLSGDMTGVNYSSARIAELQERDCWRAGQRFMIDHFAMRTAHRWLEISLLAGAITLPNGKPLPATSIDKYKAGISFTARGWDWVDPVREINAAKIAVDEGFTTRTQVVANKGGDFEENIIELEREKALLDQHNITLGSPAAKTAADSQPKGKENAETENED
jgi:lambda family phage portal protein